MQVDKIAVTKLSKSFKIACRLTINFFGLHICGFDSRTAKKKDCRLHVAVVFASRFRQHLDWNEIELLTVKSDLKNHEKSNHLDPQLAQQRAAGASHAL